MDELIDALDQTESLQSISELPEALDFPVAEAAPEGVRAKQKTVAKKKRKSAAATGATRATARKGRTKSGLGPAVRGATGEERSTRARRNTQSMPAQRGQSQLALVIVLLLVFIGAAALIVALVMNQRNQQDEVETQVLPSPPTAAPQQTFAPVPVQPAPAQPQPQPQPRPRTERKDDEEAPARGSSLFGPGGTLQQGD